MDDQPRQETKRKTFFFKNTFFSILVGLTIACLLGVSVYAIGGPPLVQWDPGETLDPGCAPGSGNCSTVPPAVYNFGANNFNGTGTITAGFDSVFGDVAGGTYLTFSELDTGTGKVPLIIPSATYTGGNVLAIQNQLAILGGTSGPSIVLMPSSLTSYGGMYADSSGELTLVGEGISVATVDNTGIYPSYGANDLGQATGSRWDIYGNTIDVTNQIKIDTGSNYNTKIGYEAGRYIVIGAANNTFLGYQAGRSSSTLSDDTADNNTAIGYQSFDANTNGGNNVSVGTYTLTQNTEGDLNVAIGSGALMSNTTGDGNIAIGYLALDSNTTGDRNTIIGYLAQNASTITSENVAVGYHALNTTTGNHNTGVGTTTLAFNTTGINNTALGYRALYGSDTASYNTALGDDAMYAWDAGDQNVAIGYQAMNGNISTNASFNVAVGNHSLYAISTGNSNATLGYNAASQNSSGASNTAIGYYTLRLNSTGSNNTAVGSSALSNNTTSYNTAVGYSALSLNTTGALNTAFGSNTLQDNVTGSWNTAIGYFALQSNNGNGWGNTAVGYRSISVNTSGANNTAIGIQTLGNNSTGYANSAFGVNALQANISGNSNVAFGMDALHENNTGTGNVALGFSAGYYVTNTTNELFVDNTSRASYAAEQAESLLYGKFAINVEDQFLKVNGGLVLLNSSPSPTSPVLGELYYDTDTNKLELYDNTGWVDVTVSSSMRYKHNIQPLADNWSKILQIQPVSFVYNGEPDTKVKIGYIAEDFDTLGLKDLVRYDTEGKPNAINYDLISLYSIEILKQQQIAINELKQRLGLPTENTAINPAGTLGSGDVSGVNLSSFDQSVKLSLANLGATLINGIISLKEVITENLTAKTARIEKMEMVDSATGDIYCTWVENGEWQKVKGDCASVVSSAVETTPTEITPTTTIPTETILTTSIDQVSQQLNDLSQQLTQQQQETQEALQQAQQTAQQAQQAAQQAQQAQQAVQQIQQVQAQEEANQAQQVVQQIQQVQEREEQQEEQQQEEQQQEEIAQPQEEEPVQEEFQQPQEEASEEPTVLESVGSLIQNTLASLINGVGNFITWLISLGLIAISSL